MIKKINMSARAKKKTSNFLFSVFRYSVLIIIGFIVLYPLIFMFTTSIKDQVGMMDGVNVWLPVHTTFDYYKQAFEILDFSNSLKRTISLQLVSALIEVFACSIIGYGFARFDFPFKKTLMAFLIVSLLIPLQMYSLPLAVNYRNLDFLGIFGLLNKLTGVDLRLSIYNTNFSFLLPALFGVGVRSGMIIYIYIQFYKGLPYELEEAAYVDGAGLFRTYFSIALPSSSVVIITASVLSVIWYWNESFLSTLCFLSEEWPLSVKLSNMVVIMTQHGIFKTSVLGGFSNIVFAGCIMFIVIPLITYLFLQRKFVKSIDRVGITG